MPKTKEQKEKMFQELEDLLKKAKSFVLIDYYGLKVKDIDQLRQNLREANCAYLVSKKTLLRRALDKLGLKNVNIDKIVGGLGLIFGLEDEVAPAKLTIQFGKNHKEMKIHGGVFENQLVDSVKIKALAKLPGKEQLKAQVVWTIGSPLSNFVSVLQGNLRNLVYALGAIKGKKS